MAVKNAHSAAFPLLIDGPAAMTTKEPTQRNISEWLDVLKWFPDTEANRQDAASHLRAWLESHFASRGMTVSVTVAIRSTPVDCDGNEVTSDGQDEVGTGLWLTVSVDDLGIASGEVARELARLGST